MMKKGKGYPDHVKDTDKSFGDPFKEPAVWGPRSMRSSLGKFEDSSFKMPDPSKTES
tara:strand:+ start:1973 stop:2143 length:171 start_codon:yes stop_codon:yes gene_type:complete